MHRQHVTRNLLLASLLFLFWMILTASLAALNVVEGAVMAAFTALVSFAVMGTYIDKDITVPVLLRFPFFALALVWEIIKANWDVMKIVLHPRLPISPRVVRFHIKLRGDLPRTFYADSITLTPGTVTIDVEDDVFYVHCLAPHHEEGLLEGKLERMVAWLFKQELGEQDTVGERVL
jgi:multicomponent Na+:H+ antiporter subunit E